MNDESLIELIAKGNQEALTELYNRYQTQIYKLSFHYLQNKEDAEEMLQDVFLAVYKNAVNFQSRSVFHTWIYKITVNKCLDKLRFRKAKKHLLFFSSLFQHPSEHISDKINDSTEDENTLQLYKAIDALGDQQKTAIILTQIQELSVKEAATIMQTTPKAVESLTQRAKTNLRKNLKK